MRRLVALPVAALVLAACQGGSAEITNVVCVGEATTYLDWLNGDLVLAEADAPAEAPEEGDLLETVRERGTLIISTDADYAPQSFLESDGTFVGFDIDVGTEIAERLGVDVEFMHVDWDAITAGNWAERWDISVGSMTITEPRKEILSFTQPYYFTPAYMGASERSGVTSVDDLDFELPDGAEPTTLTTDADCIQAIESGRTEFDLFMTSGTVIDEAVAAEQPVVKIGEPVYTEDLAVAIDQSGPEHAALLYEIDRIIGEMHEDGTLTELSEEWFDGQDLTQDPEG
jgi:polar amino acid transport system substrate-binding protein